MNACTTKKNKQNLEDDYLVANGHNLIKDNFIVITGCSGGGKSTLLSELASRGFSVVLEPGRQIVKEQQAIAGRALPWKDLDHFLELALSRYLFLFNSQEKEKS